MVILTVKDAAGNSDTASSSITVTTPIATGSLKVAVSGSSGAIQGATVTIISGPYAQTLPLAATTGTDGTVVFVNLAPGSYSYTVTAYGYEGSQTNTATVTSGQTTPSQASLQPSPPPSNTSQPNYTLYATVSVVAFVVILATFLALRRRRGARAG